MTFDAEPNAESDGNVGAWDLLLETLNSQYLSPKTVMKMCTSCGKDSGTLCQYYIEQSLSTGTKSSFH